MKPYLIVFVSVFLAELGDKTQLATLLFTANPETSRSGVLLAAAGALVTSTVLAVGAGAALGTWMAPERLNMLAGLGFIAIGAWMVWRAFG
jgi:putative Ca2+/H+ antiporter (TMEM165/GDT1 family)